MSTVIVNPPWVHVDVPVLTAEHEARGWHCRPRGILQNPNIRWTVGAVITWCSALSDKEVMWVARSERTGTSANFDTWQEAVNFADVTGALE